MTENTITINADDPTVKRIVTNLKSGKAYVAYVEKYGVTHDNLADHARALASLAFPGDDGKQTVNGKRTNYGNAVQAAGWHLRNVLGKAEAEDKPVVLRASLSGEGGGSTTIKRETNPDLYDALVALITGESMEQAA